MRLTWEERVVIYDAAIQYAKVNFKFETGPVLSHENPNTDTFRITVEDGAYHPFKTVIDVTFDSAESALDYFGNVPVQLALFAAAPTKEER